MSSSTNQTNQYIRQVLHQQESPPPITPRFFYSSPVAIDDPLSPLPTPATSETATSKEPPRPFSEYDNRALDKAWLELRRKILQYNEEHGEKSGITGTAVAGRQLDDSGLGKGKQSLERSRGALDPTQHGGTRPSMEEVRSRQDSAGTGSELGESEQAQSDRSGKTTLLDSLNALDGPALPVDAEEATTTGTPFIRAPSRKATTLGTLRGSSQIRPEPPQPVDSYKWGSADGFQDDLEAEQKVKHVKGPSAKVAVGVSRLHSVVMPELHMEPIYWAPIHDTASVIRGTWFYKDTMLPVETPVANMLEAGYVELQPWTETWQDELNSAIEVGAAGEMKIMRMLWPEPAKGYSVDSSRPGTARGDILGTVSSSMVRPEPETPEKQRVREAEAASDVIDIVSGPEADNKASGNVTYGRYGPTRTYALSGVIYGNSTEAHILKPSLQPSTYYGRRPLANYIRKNRKLGVPVVRGFDQAAWNKLHPPKKGSTTRKAKQGVSTSQDGADLGARQRADAELSESQSPKVTDLVLVIHGIGQKLSERMESYHFTHAINAFRREVNVELGTDSVKANLRKDAGGIMILPVNWRHRLSFEEGGYRDEAEELAANHFSLKDITPDTLPSVRNIISDVLLDIPFYLSHHQPKMIAAVIGEANRIYKLWCDNNPGFCKTGRVHILAHSLGSVMAIDILSQQPTKIPAELQDLSSVDPDVSHFLFNTTNLFTAGSPAGFFVLLKHGALLPRVNYDKAGKDASADTSLVCGDHGTYGCIAVENIYNVLNPYDPVAYRLNATVDASYAASIKSAWVPSAVPGWFSTSNSWFRSPEDSVPSKFSTANPVLPRLPSNVELETHNFSREEIAEKRMYLLNDNGQIDYFLRYGGGPLEIQYLTMLGAHSSYWHLKDFVRMIVLECGRRPGRDGALLAMRAVKRKPQLS